MSQNLGRRGSRARPIWAALLPALSEQEPWLHRAGPASGAVGPAPHPSTHLPGTSAATQPSSHHSRNALGLMDTVGVQRACGL